MDELDPTHPHSLLKNVTKEKLKKKSKSKCKITKTTDFDKMEPSFGSHEHSW